MMQKYGLFFLVFLSCAKEEEKIKVALEKIENQEQNEISSLKNEESSASIANQGVSQIIVQETSSPLQDSSLEENASQGSLSANQGSSTHQNIPQEERSLGMGLAGITDYTGSFPFIDLMKQARSWNDWASKIEGFDLDENDWVKSLKPNQTAGTVFLTVNKNVPVKYTKIIVTYEGEGVIDYQWSAKKIKEESSKGRDVIQVGTGNHLLVIKETKPENYIRNIKMIPVEFEEKEKQGEIFNPDWLEKIKTFRGFRFMDWMKTNNSTASTWESRPQKKHRTWTNVPLEVMIELANRFQAVPWFNIPHLADEKYIENFAAQVKKELHPSLPFFVEHSNEVWNWQFQQAQYANKTGRAMLGEEGNAYIQWHGMKTGLICDIFKEKIFINEKERVKCVLGIQTGYKGLHKGALECPLWVAKGHKACSEYGIDYLGLTGYFSGGLNGPRKIEKEEDQKYADTIKQMAQSGDDGLKKAFEQLEKGSILHEFSSLKDFKGVYQEIKERTSYWMEEAQKYHLKGVVAYEGGQHITANALTLQDDENVISFHTKVNEDSRMKNIYQQVFKAWKDAGGKMFFHFVELGQPSKWGSWGALKHLDEKSSPKWDAILEFHKTPCWFDECK